MKYTIDINLIAEMQIHVVQQKQNIVINLK